MNRKRFALLALLLAPLALTGCMNKVEPGYAAVVVNTAGSNRAITMADVKVGRFTTNPFNQDVYKFRIAADRQEWTGEKTLVFQSKEGMRVSSDAVFMLSADVDSVPYLFNTYRKTTDQLLGTLVRDVVNRAVKSAGGHYAAVDLLGPKSDEFQAHVEKVINERLAKEGFKVTNFALVGELHVPANVKAALNASNEATQKAVQAENELRTTRAEGEKTVAQAQAKAKAQEAEAQGTAAAILAKAEAQAKANRTLAASITSELIQYKKIEKWDGKNSQVTGSDGNLLINVK